MKKVIWQKDEFACSCYNIVAAFESTLINMSIIDDYSNIEETEDFVSKYGANHEQHKQHKPIKTIDFSNFDFEEFARKSQQ